MAGRRTRVRLLNGGHTFASFPILAFDLIVFDLDGTLIDSRRDLADATNALIVELGGTALSQDEVTAMVGEGAAVLVKRALAAARLDAPAARSARPVPRPL